MMNEKAYENKVDRDVNKTKKDFTTLGEDNVAGLSRIKKDLVTLGDDGVTGFNMKLDQLVDDTQEMVAASVKSFNQEVRQGLHHYNAKLQDVADNIPGNFAKNASGYPWVTITISLVLGFILGFVLKPGRQPTS
jgi:ElaB/YqjD/DUF883 family membrane-anchored ribosome-binding protein